MVKQSIFESDSQGFFRSNLASSPLLTLTTAISNPRFWLSLAYTNVLAFLTFVTCTEGSVSHSAQSQLVCSQKSSSERGFSLASSLACLEEPAALSPDVVLGLPTVPQDNVQLGLYSTIYFGFPCTLNLSASVDSTNCQWKVSRETL